MNISTSTSLSQSGSFGFPLQERNTSGNMSEKGLVPSSLNAVLLQESYSKTSVSLDFSSKDGDTVHLELNQLQYSRSIQAVSLGGDKQDLKDLVAAVRENLEKLMEHFSSGGQNTIDSVTENEKSEGANPDLEYWNAENTSQRIVDFSLSFFSGFKGEKDEFLTTIRNAIDEGFKQAREFMGKLSDEVASLVNDTYSLVMKKLDDWGSAGKTDASSGVEVTV